MVHGLGLVDAAIVERKSNVLVSGYATACPELYHCEAAGDLIHHLDSLLLRAGHSLSVLDS